MNSVQFISAFIDIGSSVKSAEHRIRLFKYLAESGLPIHVFLSSSFLKEYYLIVGTRHNVTVETIELESLETYKELAGLSYTVPKSSNPAKDTAAYHIVQNAKVELVERARQGHKATHFAWIDFNICQMFKNIPECLEYLRNGLRLEPGLFMPGCWSLTEGQENLFSSINWRFCGSFFIGDAESIEGFYRAYRENFKKVVESVGILTWEVNVWHFMEINALFGPVWYIADHNDSIIRA